MSGGLGCRALSPGLPEVGAVDPSIPSAVLGLAFWPWHLLFRDVEAGHSEGLRRSREPGLEGLESSGRDLGGQAASFQGRPDGFGQDCVGSGL